MGIFADGYGKIISSNCKQNHDVRILWQRYLRYFLLTYKKITIRVHEWNDEGLENYIIHSIPYHMLTLSGLLRHVLEHCACPTWLRYKHPFRIFQDDFFLNSQRFSMFTFFNHDIMMVYCLQRCMKVKLMWKSTGILYDLRNKVKWFGHGGK